MFEGEFDEVIWECRGGDAYEAVIPLAAGDLDVRLDGHGADEAVVVIGVLANKVDAAGGADVVDVAAAAEAVEE